MSTFCYIPEFMCPADKLSLYLNIKASGYVGYCLGTYTTLSNGLITSAVAVTWSVALVSILRKQAPLKEIIFEERRYIDRKGF